MDFYGTMATLRPLWKSLHCQPSKTQVQGRNLKSSDSFHTTLHKHTGICLFLSPQPPLFLVLPLFCPLFCHQGDVRRAGRCEVKGLHRVLSALLSAFQDDVFLFATWRRRLLGLPWVWAADPLWSQGKSPMPTDLRQTLWEQNYSPEQQLYRNIECASGHLPIDLSWDQLC